MRRIRKWLAVTSLALALLVPLGIVASADPTEPGACGGGCFTSAGFSTTSTKPGK